MKNCSTSSMSKLFSLDRRNPKQKFWYWIQFMAREAKGTSWLENQSLKVEPTAQTTWKAFSRKYSSFIIQYLLNPIGNLQQCPWALKNAVLSEYLITSLSPNFVIFCKAGLQELTLVTKISILRFTQCCIFCCAYTQRISYIVLPRFAALNVKSFMPIMEMTLCRKVKVWYYGRCFEHKRSVF